MSEAPLNDELLEEFRREFYADPKNQFAQNVCSRMDPMEASVSRERFNQTQHFFTHKIDTEGKPVSDQKNTGRCWIFACLNAIRLPFMKENNLEEFEFSQAFIFFWDKIERSNFFLHNAIKTARRGEAVDGRLVSFLLQDPLGDGGQWDMVVNVINKHGLVPKKLFPDTASCEKSARMNTLLRSKLREYCKILRELVEQGADDERLQTEIRSQMSTIYRIVSICIGTPPKTFKWEYYTKSKEYKSVGPVSPHDFYHKHVKPTYNMDDKVCLVTDPRSTNQFGKSYTIDCLGNVVGGRPIVYNNQQVELLMELGAKSIKDNEPVWFGCDVSKRLAVKEGIEDLKIHDYQLVFGVDVHLGMTKAERLMFGDSAMTHAMVFSGVSMEGDKPVKWRVENSWGEEHGQKGYFVMTSDWFKEFVFELVVDKKYVPEHVMKVFELEPIVLPAWDPMGTLA